MKLYTFYRENNNFDDIINDKELKSLVATKIFFKNHLMIGFKQDVKESTVSYMVLKYGEFIINPVPKDYRPVPKKDYMPKK